VTTQTVAPTIPITAREPPSTRVVSSLVERVVQFPRLHPKSIDATLARAIDEAFESLARETRS